MNPMKEKFNLISAGRNLRGEYNIATAKKIPYHIKPTTEAFENLLIADAVSVQVLLNAESLNVDSQYEPEGKVPSGTAKFGLIYMPLAGIIDIEAETERQTKRKNELEKVLFGIDKKLSNEKFLNGAPPHVVEGEKQRQKEYQAELEQVKQLLIELDQI